MKHLKLTVRLIVCYFFPELFCIYLFGFYSLALKWVFMHKNFPNWFSFLLNLQANVSSIQIFFLLI